MSRLYNLSKFYTKSRWDVQLIDVRFPFGEAQKTRNPVWKEIKKMTLCDEGQVAKKFMG